MRTSRRKKFLALNKSLYDPNWKSVMQKQQRMTPRQAFNVIYNGGKNFMTPNILETRNKGKYIYELSSGRGFENDTIYGVTILERTSDGKVTKTEKNKSFNSIDEARNYIRGL
jgi:hypothetical protein